MLRNSAVDLGRGLVGLSDEKSIVVPLRRSPSNSSRKVNSSILGAFSHFRFDVDVSLRRIPDDPRQRHFFLLRETFECPVKTGRKTDRRTDPGWALSFRGFLRDLFAFHTWIV